MNAEAVDTFARFQRVLQVVKFEPYEDASAVVADFREGLLVGGPWRDERAFVALALAERCVQDRDYDQARVWALRGLQDGPRFDAFALLGDLAEHDGQINDAIRWYECALQLRHTDARYSSFPKRAGLDWKLRELNRRQKEIDSRASLVNIPMRAVRWVSPANHHTIFDEFGNMAGLFALVDAHIAHARATGLVDYMTVGPEPLRDDLRTLVQDVHLDEDVSAFVWSSPYRVRPAEPAWLMRDACNGVNVADDFRLITVAPDFMARLHRLGQKAWIESSTFGQLVLHNVVPGDLFAFYAPQVLS